LHASIKNHTRRETSTKFISFENKHHWFYKFSNSFIFTDEDESSWKDWRNKMNDKLIVNVDQFDDDIICIVYMMFRLEDDAAKHIFARHCFDSLNSFTSIYELFDHLKKIYDELNKNQKSWCEYNALRQEDKSFNVFYFDFMKLFSYLDYDDHTLMNDLQNKINNRLQNVLSVCSKNFTSLSRLKKFLQDVNNKQWVNYQLRSERRTVIVKVTVVPDKHATSLSVMTSIIDYVKSIIFSIFESDRAKLSIICYICKTSSHLFKNCSQNKIDILTSQAFTLRLHEIIISKDKENEKMSSFKNSDSEVIFLKFMIKQRSIQIKQFHINAIISWSDLKSVKNILIFLKFARFYQQFIKEFFQIIMLLTYLIKNAKKKMMHLLFTMTLKTRKVFKRLKAVFVNAFILKHYNWDANFCMKINVSNHEVEDVLSQKDKTDQWHLIIYYNYKFKEVEVW